MINNFIRLSTRKISRDEFDKDVNDTMDRLRSERNSNFEIDFEANRNSIYKMDLNSKESNFQLHQVLGEISSSDDEDDDQKNNKKDKSNTDAILNKLKEQFSDKYEGLELIDIVENNEIKEITTLTADKNSCVTFSTSSEFEIPKEEK